MANLGNGANDIIRAYSPGGRARDIAGTQDDIGTLTHQTLYSGAEHLILNTVDRLRERTLTSEWRRSDTELPVTTTVAATVCEEDDASSSFGTAVD